MRRILLTFVAVVLLFSTTILYADGAGKTLQELKQESDAIFYKSYISKEDAEQLSVLSDSVLKLDPKDTEAYQRKAFALDMLGKSKEASAVYDKAAKLMPGNSELLYYRATHLMTYKDYSGAIQSYESFLKTDDKAFIAAQLDQVWRDEAEAYYSLKKYKEAIACIDKFVTKGNYYYDFDYSMKKGLALLELKRYSEASKWLTELKKHVVPYEYGKLAMVYYYNACAASMQGQTGQALNDLSVAFKFDPGYKSKAITENYLKGISKRKDFTDLVTFDDNLLKKLKLGKDFYVVDHLKYDLNGDKSNEDIVLVGRKCSRDNINIEQLSLVIVNSKTGRYDNITPKYTEGIIFDDVKDYLYLNDLNGDGLKDIIIKLWAPGGEKVCAYSYKGSKAVMVFGAGELSEGLTFTTSLVDGSKAQIQYPGIGTVATLDLSAIPADRRTEPGRISRFWDLQPVDADGDKVYEIKGYQVVDGFGSAYDFGNLITTLKYDRVKADWVVSSIEYKR